MRLTADASTVTSTIVARTQGVRSSAAVSRSTLLRTDALLLAGASWADLA
jgi:hypothetical protein